MKSAIVLLSGGMDSTTLLAHALREGYEVRALSVHYGQRHYIELSAAEDIAKSYGVEHRTVELGHLNPFFRGSSQTDASIDVPEGHYAEESMKMTVVPNRNMIMLAVAGAWAISTKSDVIAYAAHAGDHAIYPDCRPEFIGAMARALLLADWHAVDIWVPFQHRTKAFIARLGTELGVDFSKTWSCYKGTGAHCGKCGTCVERKEAFQLAGVADPTEYVS
jgi:7-cyano-7-deazaguanine synthase